MKADLGFCKPNTIINFLFLNIFQSKLPAGNYGLSTGQLRQIERHPAIKAEQIRNTTGSGFKLVEFEQNQEK